MDKRIVFLVLLSLTSLAAVGIPHAHANYRITTTAVDLWPTTPTGGGIATGLTVAQASSQGTNQIVTAGVFSNVTNQAQLRIYHKTGNSLVLETNKQWSFPVGSSFYLSGVQVAKIAASQLENETITIGNAQLSPNQPSIASQIGIWRWTGTTMIRETLYNFTGPGSALETRGIAIWDNGARQIVTIGYYNRTGVAWAQLGVWSWDGATFSKNSLWNWTAAGTGSKGAQGYAVATADLEGTGTPDIITVGTDNNGTMTRSDLRVWAWSGSGNPLLKVSRTWVTTGQGSAATSISVQDLNGDGKKEVIVGGLIFSYPFVKPELTVWQYSASPSPSISLQAETNWQTSSQTSAELVHVATGDVDNSGTGEIVTAGFYDQPVGTTDVYYGIIRSWTWTGSAIILQQSYQYSTVPTALYAVAVADIDKGGKQDIIVGGQQILKGMVEVRDASFVYGSISLNVNPSPAQAGQSATISGTITNATDQTPLASMQLLMEYSNSSGAYQIIATVTTDPQGRFATSFTPPGTGSYTVRAIWFGDNSHMGTSTTTSLVVNKVASVIVLSSSAFTAQPGDTVTISGYVYPATATTITLTYTSPGGTVTTHTVTSDDTGAFTDQYTINSSGAWKVAASWPGSSTLAGSKSNSLNIQAQPQPIELSLALYGFIIALAAVALAAFGLARKTGGKPSPIQSPKL